MSIGDVPAAAGAARHVKEPWARHWALYIAAHQPVI
jgi:hypothetical protein